MGFEYGYRFARQAAADVTGIVDYLAGDLANPTAAASFKKSLMECLDTLRMFPQSGSLVQNGYVPQTGIREKLVGNYILFYQTDAETRTVYILRVVHGSRDLDRVVKLKIFPQKRDFPLEIRTFFCYTILAAWCGRLKWPL